MSKRGCVWETFHPRSFFYPAWEILPHESKLPHADVISERLETLVALGQPSAPLIVANVVALLQRTFAPAALLNGTKTLKRGRPPGTAGLGGMA